MTDDEKNAQRTKNFLLYKVRLTDEEMEQNALPAWVVNLLAVLVILIVGALGYLCIFHLK